MFSIIAITVLIIIELTMIKNVDLKPELINKRFKASRWLTNNYSFIAIFLIAYIVSIIVNVSTYMSISTGDKRELFIVFLLLSLLTALQRQLLDLKPVQFQHGVLPPDSQEIKDYVSLDSTKRFIHHRLYFVFVLSIIASIILITG